MAWDLGHSQARPSAGSGNVRALKHSFGLEKRGGGARERRKGEEAGGAHIKSRDPKPDRWGKNTEFVI